MRKHNYSIQILILIFRSSSAQLHIVPWVENSFPSNFIKSFNVNEKANEYPSLSRSDIATGNIDVNQLQEELPSALVQNTTSNNLGSGVYSRAISGDRISLCGIAVGEQSLPGIVMEQEELSDSEEELGEHVEFECEEMNDSEGDEGSDSGQIKGLSHTKEDMGTASGKQALSLNLNSFPKTDSKTRVEMTDLKCPTGRSGPPSRPSRSCKKPSFQNHFTSIMLLEVEIRPVLDLLALSSSKGLRNRLGRKTT